MATNKTKIPAADKVAKPKRAPVALPTRIRDQLDRATLSKKITSEELAALASHITKLQSFLD